jgi:hypothetical protein
VGNVLQIVSSMKSWQFLQNSDAHRVYQALSRTESAENQQFPKKLGPRLPGTSTQCSCEETAGNGGRNRDTEETSPPTQATPEYKEMETDM